MELVPTGRHLQVKVWILILALKHVLARPALAEEAEFTSHMETGRGGTSFVIDAALTAFWIF